jgi:hypothetical protein
VSSQSEHTDPEFEERYHFCRTECAECDRLDREEMANGMTLEERNAEAVGNVLAALRDGWGGRWERMN